jgi:hypothetical protein
VTERPTVVLNIDDDRYLKASGETHSPVFVDPTGRRRRLLTRLGIGLAGAFVLLLVVLVAGLLIKVQPGGMPRLPAVPDDAAATPGPGSASPTTAPSRPAATPRQAGPTASASRAAPSSTRPTAVASSPATFGNGDGHRHVPTQSPTHKDK